MICPLWLYTIVRNEQMHVAKIWDDGDALQSGFTLYFKILPQLNLWRSLIPITRNVSEVFWLFCIGWLRNIQRLLHRAIVHRLLWSLKSHGIDESVFCLPSYRNVFAIQTLRSLKISQRTKEWVIVFHLGGVIRKFCSFSPSGNFRNSLRKFLPYWKLPETYYKGFEESLGAMSDDWDMERWLFVRNHSTLMLLQVFSLQSLKSVCYSIQQHPRKPRGS